MSDTSISAPITRLPGEIHNQILSYLDVIDRISLKLASVYFNSIIPKLSPKTLQEAELSTFADTRDLYGCYDCLRLRAYRQFADDQLRKWRASGSQAQTRFCIECGLATRDGRVPRLRYVRGSQIDIRSVAHIVCMYCSRFKLMASEEGYPECSELCIDCWTPLQVARRRVEETRRRADMAARGGNNGKGSMVSTPAIAASHLGRQPRNGWI
ncbi:hypothetical protein PspLS_10788 [Pyricularia sp. CBS 133598]|nr:hypothetical protein PspLS_10788 [Pyricularia sp. CBS 133598]